MRTIESIIYINSIRTIRTSIGCTSNTLCTGVDNYLGI